MKKTMDWGEDPEFSGPRNWFRESLLMREIRRFKKKGYILDFGCGSGNLLIRLAKQGYSGKGVDISASAIAFLQKKINENHLESVLTAARIDAKYLTSTSHRFDIVVSGETLEHVRNDQNIIDGFFRVLNKKGICVISVPAHPKLWDSNDDFSKHFRRYEANELVEKFRKSGFRVITVYYWGYPLSYYWHKYAFLPLIEKRVDGTKPYTKLGIFGWILSFTFMKQLLSYPFWIDELFNATKRGPGLILVAEK